MTSGCGERKRVRESERVESARHGDTSLAAQIPRKKSDRSPEIGRKSAAALTHCARPVVCPDLNLPVSLSPIWLPQAEHHPRIQALLSAAFIISLQKFAT